MKQAKLVHSHRKFQLVFVPCLDKRQYSTVFLPANCKKIKLALTRR